MKLIFDSDFWHNPKDECSSVCQIFPDVYTDNRGDFSEVYSHHCVALEWLFKEEPICQINRSKSHTGVFRGLHAQRGEYCQGKLVEAVNRRIEDIIIDARPESSTFMLVKKYILDPETQNKLWVPRGFLHGFYVPESYIEEDAILQYYVDNDYCKDAEICISPTTVNNDIVSNITDISEKDNNGWDFNRFCDDVLYDYVEYNNIWYK